MKAELSKEIMKLMDFATNRSKDERKALENQDWDNVDFHSSTRRAAAWIASEVFGLDYEQFMKDTEFSDNTKVEIKYNGQVFYAISYREDSCIKGNYVLTCVSPFGRELIIESRSVDDFNFESIKMLPLSTYLD